MCLHVRVVAYLNEDAPWAGQRILLPPGLDDAHTRAAFQKRLCGHETPDAAANDQHIQLATRCLHVHTEWPVHATAGAGS